MSNTLQLLKRSAQTHPNQIAVIDEAGELSYSALLKQTEFLQQQLQNCGVTSGMGIGVMGKNSREFIIAMLAVLGCGAVAIPISHQLKASELDDLLNDTRAHAVIDDQAGILLPNLDSTPIMIADIRLRFSRTKHYLQPTIIPLQDAAFIRYTSGTTGASKGVVLTHQRILQRVDVALKALKISANDKILWVLPMAFHFLVSILVYIKAGATLIICREILADTIINTANQYQATLLYAAPMHFRLLAFNQLNLSMPTLKHAISTSAAIDPNIAETFQSRYQIPLIQAYGIIEAGIPILDTLENNDHRTVGFPVDGFEARLFNTKKQAITAIDQPGDLAIRGSGMFNAYLKPWQLSEQLTVNGWFFTGDIAKYLADGKIMICGRKKSMINIVGNKVFPEQVEAVLNRHPDIVDSYVYGGAHPIFGEIVCADVIINNETTANKEQLLQFCRNHLSSYKVPQKLQIVEQLPTTRSGKIKRN